MSYEQVSVPSSQVSTEQDIASSQVPATPPHVPEVHSSETVQKRPSSHDVPSVTGVPTHEALESHMSLVVHSFASSQAAPTLAVQSVCDVVGVHTWHPLAGFVAPVA